MPALLYGGLFSPDACLLCPSVHAEEAICVCLCKQMKPFMSVHASRRSHWYLSVQADDAIAAKISAKGRQPDSNTTLWACLSRLVNYKDGSPMHPQKLSVNTGQFFWAGHDTSSSTITWCLFELAADPATQVPTWLPSHQTPA